MGCCSSGTSPTARTENGRQVQVQPATSSTAGAASATKTSTEGPRVAAVDGSIVDNVKVDIAPPLRKSSGNKNPPQGNAYGVNHDVAAKNIQAHIRGQRDRHRVMDQYRAFQGKETPLRPEELGFAYYAEEHPSMPIVPDQLRYGVRDTTARLLLGQLGLAQQDIIYSFEECAYLVLRNLRNEKDLLTSPVRKQMGFVRYFMDPWNVSEESAPAEQAFFTEKGSLASQQSVGATQDTHRQLQASRTQDSRFSDSLRKRKELYLLGQFDCLAVVARADYNACFDHMPHGRLLASGGTVTSVSDTAKQLAVAEGHEVPLESNEKTDDHHHDDLTAGGAVHPTDASVATGVLLPHTPEEPTTEATPILLGGAAHEMDQKKAHDCEGPEGLAGWFWVVHSAAPNIGESTNADDFMAYSKEEATHTSATYGSGTHAASGGTYWSVHGTYQPQQSSLPYWQQQQAQCCWKTVRSRRRLDEDLYLSHMARLWRNALMAMGRLDVLDAVVFPFGMGAFLRHLGQNDDRYNDPRVMRALRRRIADRFVEAVSEICLGALPPVVSSTDTQGSKPGTKDKKAKKEKKAPPPQRRGSVANVRGPARVHLCLVVSNPESVENHNCFLEAVADKVQAIPKLRDIVHLRRNVDCLQLAHDISSKYWQKTGAPKVAILNGASRKLVGNHWFQGGARFAIDENLHRRSASLARAALLLNLNTEPIPRKPLQLASTVVRWGGQVFRASDGKRLFVDGPDITGTTVSIAKPRGSGGSCCFCCCKRRHPVSRGSAPVAQTARQAESAQQPAHAPGARQAQPSASTHDHSGAHAPGHSSSPGPPITGSTQAAFNPPPAAPLALQDKMYRPPKSGSGGAHAAQAHTTAPAAHASGTAPNIPPGGIHMGRRDPNTAAPHAAQAPHSSHAASSTRHGAKTGDSRSGWY